MSRYFRPVLSRRLHASRPHIKGDLIGPSDPLSNLRPVVYGGVPEPLLSATRFYSEAELRGKQQDPHEFSLNFAKTKLDALNHAYWADVRTIYILRFLDLTRLIRVTTVLNTLRKHSYASISPLVSIPCQKKSGTKLKNDICPNSTRSGSYRRKRNIRFMPRSG